MFYVYSLADVCILVEYIMERERERSHFFLCNHEFVRIREVRTTRNEM